MNHNDLRYKKTEALLMQVYMDIKQKSTKPVKLVDLCNAAMINKTTFYAHYETLDAFHHYVCKTYLTNLLSSCDHTQDALTDTRTFVYGLVKMFTENQQTINALFRDETSDIVGITEEYLIQKYCSPSDDISKNIAFRFAIGGTTRILVNTRDEKMIEKTVELIEKVIR